MATTITVNNSRKPAPKWFRKLKKIWINSENTLIVLLMASGYAAESFLILCIKVGTSWGLDVLETLLANGEEYSVPEPTNGPDSK